MTAHRFAKTAETACANAHQFTVQTPCPLKSTQWPLAQSPPSLQFLPAAHGEHGAPPPQSVLVSPPLRTPSVQLAHPELGLHV
jgi:hypothetical protein